MSAELPKSERARLMSELDEFFPEVKHSEREMHLLDENQQLESRIAALSVALTEADDIRARLEAELVEAYRLLELEKAKDGDTWKERAVTERAAREKAEKEAAQYKLWCDETAKSHDATNAHLEQAEQERDTAMARVAEVTEQRDLWAKQCNMASEAQADAASKLSTALARVKELEDSNRALRMTNRVEEADADNQRERRRAAETALASALARVKKLERIIDSGRDLLEDVRAEKHAAETALASARTTLEKLDSFVRAEMPGSWRSILLGIIHTSHPAPVAVLPPISESDEAIVGALIDARTQAPRPMAAPVAAPERGTRDVVETAIDLTKDDKHSRWNDLGELPVTVMATSKYPSPAPCAGCEELKKERHEYVVKLDALREEINETRANWDACHRQHEQCMKLLGRIQALLLDPNAQRTEWKIRNVQDLLREMLSKGELPEGWDE